MRNSRQLSETSLKAKRLCDEIAKPSFTMEVVGMRDLPKPLKAEIHLASTYLHIDRDQLVGSFSIKEISPDVEKRLSTVSIELVQ